MDILNNSWNSVYSLQNNDAFYTFAVFNIVEHILDHKIRFSIKCELMSHNAKGGHNPQPWAAVPHISLLPAFPTVPSGIPSVRFPTEWLQIRLQYPLNICLWQSCLALCLVHSKHWINIWASE